MEKLRVRITLTAEMLGTVSGNEDIMSDFIAAKVLDEKNTPQLSQGAREERNQEEKETAPKEDDNELIKGSTIFHRDDDNNPFIYGYMVKGFFKAACDAIIDTPEYTAADLKKVKLGRWSYKSTINKLIAIKERRIILQTPKDKGLTFIERPLRAETMKGDRVCLARSEAVPEGTILECTVCVLNNKLLPYIKRWLDYGEVFGGLGQWRSSHYGSFIWEEIK